MNEFEREVARSQLTAERHTLDELEEIYRQAADEICRKLEISNGKISVLLSEIENADEKTLSVLQSQIYQRNFKQSIKKQLDFLLKDLNDNQYTSISEYLENCYNNGFIGTLYNFNMNDIPLNIPIDPTLVVRAIHIESKLSKRLYDELEEDVEILKRKVSATISRGIASNMHYNDIARNIASNSKTGLNRAMTITRTEGNRIYNAANLDCGKAAKEKGVDDIKQWDSTLDGNTRPHHRQLDGQVRELEEDFEVANIKAPAPLQFGIPGEDINCRCICLVKPRWDVDSAFTKIDNETGQLLEFEGTKDFEDFKKRYWESVDKFENDDIIEEKTEKMVVCDVHSIGKIDIEKFKCVTKDIQTDEVIITDERIHHIKDRHPNDYERYYQYMQQIITNPDYIIEANKPNTALVLKSFSDGNEQFKTILRLVTSTDNSNFKNSIITFMKINDKEWQRLLRNKKVLYKSE